MSEHHEYGHVLNETADFSALAGLPMDITFRVLRQDESTADKRARNRALSSIWFIAVEPISSPKKLAWNPETVPMSRPVCPSGSPEFEKMARDQAGTYFRVVQQIHEAARETDSPAGLGEQSLAAGVSLSLQISTLLDKTMLTLISDPNQDIEFAWITAPRKILKIRSECLSIHSIYENGRVQMCGLVDAPKLTAFIKKFQKIKGVEVVSMPTTYLKWIGISEYNAFVKEGFSDNVEDFGILPSPEILTPIAERAADGTVKTLQSARHPPKSAR